MQESIYRKNTYGVIQPDGFLHVWEIKRLWELAANMPTKRVRVEQIKDLDLVCWFPDGAAPTCRIVIEHARRIQDAAFNYPIILSAVGHVMDGMHRVGKALLLGMDEIEAVQFEHDPEPDEKIKVD